MRRRHRRRPRLKRFLFRRTVRQTSPSPFSDQLRLPRSSEQMYVGIMDDTWWVGPDDLDEEQERAVGLPTVGSFVVTGPPGSGKSNLLLLRATHLHLEDRSNFVLLVFTAALKTFLAHGHDYDFPPERIQTYIGWARALLRGNGQLDDLPEPFEEARKEIEARLHGLINSGTLGRPWDTILVDEGQDYTAGETRIFFSLAKNVFIVGDNSQSIHVRKPREWLDVAKTYASRHITLLFNYRNGVRICEVADEVGSGIRDYVNSVQMSKYNEDKAPSSVELVSDIPADGLLDELDRRIGIQLDSYASGYIGVLVPKRYQIEPTFSLLRLSQVGHLVARLDIDSREFQRSNSRVLLGSIHSAKGFEFRAVHLVGMHDLKLSNPRNVALVGITRAKTSLVVYREKPFRDFLEGALTQSSPTKAPKLADLFARKRKK